MPPKSSNKKVAAASWYHCDVCNVNITSTQRENHEKVCPIKADDSGPLEYIRDGCLYTASLERRNFTIEELKHMPVKYVNHLIYISEGAMRLSKFHIGQEVMVHSTERAELAPLVRSIWPIPEKFLTSVFVTAEDFNLYWEHFKGTVLKIQKLPNDFPTPAKTVRLQLQKSDVDLDFDEDQLKDLERILKQELKQLIYTKGSCIHINFFNKQLKLIVSDWVDFDMQTRKDKERSLAQAMSSLKISEPHAEDFFKVTPGTSIEVERLTDDCEDADESKYLITKANIGGLDKQLSIIEESIEFALGFQTIPKGVKISRGLLLYGPTGCGKTMICEAMSAAVQQRCTETKTNVVTINTNELFSKFLGETEKNLSEYFEKAFANYPQPTLLIIEDVHNLCPKQETNEMVRRVSSAFVSMLDALSSRKAGQRSFLLATTSNMDGLNANLRRCGRLDCEVEISAPSPKERSEILHCLLHKVEHNITEDSIEEVAQITHGFVGADLANLIYSASLLAFKSDKTKISIADIHSSLTHVKPSAMREVLIENPNVRWADIGGQAELKLKLKQAIEWPLQHPEKFKRLGIKPPRGILMFGPPGCSKTMIAKALATESQLNFLSIKGPELFSMWVGESERAVRDVFRKARQVAPAIVFFDEIDAIGGERGDAGGSGSGSSVQERVLTQLLTEMDGVETLQNVTIVAATNRPDMIDKALLRPGRIDRIIYVGLPDAEARREIFRIKVKAMPLAEDISMDELVQRTDGYSGAEIHAVCQEAAMKALEESFDSENVKWEHFVCALDLVQPRTSPDLLRLYEDYVKKS